MEENKDTMAPTLLCLGLIVMCRQSRTWGELGGHMACFLVNIRV